MIILIPLGGTGERFKKNLYKEPKALIKVLGKPILFYLLDNLNLTNVEFVYIPYNKEYEHFRFEDLLKKKYTNITFKFLKLPRNTEGACETINIALKELNIEDQSILSLDCDNFYTTDIIKLWDGMNSLLTFNDLNTIPIYSYIKVNDNKIIDIKEKQKISNHACTGAYGFSSYKLLLKYSDKIIKSDIRQNNEYYISNIIKMMIDDDIYFYNITINNEYYTCLGTPLQLRQFCNNYPMLSCIDNLNKISKLRLCFDLDNTLVSYPEIPNDYNTVKPIIKNIKFLKYLRSFGHTIIIYTARRMKTCNGNVGKIMADVGKITFDTLQQFEIPYDEIYFGKPHADIYIDDLGLNCFDDMEKSLGFYMDIVNPRDFNELSNNTIEIFMKKSDDLSGEIYYYNNIPKNIKDMFPILIDYDETNKWYKIEKISGLTLTSLYLSELLTHDNLIHVMNSIKRIQSSEKDIIDDINIYENYSNKLKKRYESYDYSIFSKDKETYNILYNKLKKYETNNMGNISVIHGDPVMTNILINMYDKIKFIDMRGKQGTKCTIYGDWLYDWAKLYQSLVGYDKILQDKPISIEYEKKMIKIFECYFCKLYSENDLKNLKTITKSLLFSLIPLHNNKNVKYYNLIFTF
jgi:capsule biosynthesis phosphatase